MISLPSRITPETQFIKKVLDQGLLGKISLMRARIAHPAEVLAHSNAQHGRLVKALRRRDGARAVRMIREHIEGTEHVLAGLI